MATKYKVISLFDPMGESTSFTFAEPLDRTYAGCHPLVHYAAKPAWCIVPYAGSKDELRKQLHAMLEALDEPHLKIIPERVVSATLV